jgi:hypothetical protein
MRSIGEQTRTGLLVLLAWLLAWGLTTLLIALLAPRFALAMLGLTLLNLVAIGLAWRSRAIPTGQDTEWAEAIRRPVRHATSPSPTRPAPAPFPPTRPLRLAGQLPMHDERGVATIRHTHIYDN